MKLDHSLNSEGSMVLSIPWTVNILSLDLQPPELGEKIFLLFYTTKFVVLCYSNLRKLIQINSIQIFTIV